jgi:hypothetical protein
MPVSNPSSWRKAMSDTTFESGHSACRSYAFELPYRIPIYGVGFAVSKLKQIEVWEQLPRALRVKIKSAKESWSSLKITKSDLDAIPDEVWHVIATEFDLEWTSAKAA